MLWHQQQAQELANLVQGRTTRPELLRLALSIRTARRSDLARMTAWLVPTPPLLTTSFTWPRSRRTAGSRG